jgi:peptidoglycan glycosyltransferase
MFAMTAINQRLDLDVNTLGVPFGLFAGFITAHFAVRRFAAGADPALLPISFVLSGIGIAFIARLKPALAVNQVIWLFVGLALMVAVLVFLRNPERLARYKYTLMLVGVFLLLSPLIPVLGQEIYGSRIWLALGPFSFQPGEIAKILIVLFLAGYLAANREMLSVFTWRVGPVNLPDIRILLPMLFMWAIALLIVVFEKDLGSALVFFTVFLTMLYAATGKKFYLVIGIALAAIGGIAAWMAFPHVQVRVATWLDPFADASNTGYQLVQSIFSLADGGLFGTGIGRGQADIIPIVESDFIFAAIAEETGLLGAAGLLLLYLCLTIRGLVTAARARSDVASFIAVGLTATIILQAFIIVGGVTRLIPLTGLTLPFVSQGGTSLLAGFIAIGFLLSCGNEATGVGKEMQSGATGTIDLTEREDSPDYSGAQGTASGRRQDGQESPSQAGAIAGMDVKAGAHAQAGPIAGAHAQAHAQAGAIAGAHAQASLIAASAAAARETAGAGLIHTNSVLGRFSLGRRLTSLMVIFSLMFALLVANLTLIMVVRADEYRSMPGNNHVLAREAQAERGTISTYDNVVLAQSVKQDDGSYVRVYPSGDLASHVVGYYSQQYGSSGIEAAYSNTLKGQENFASFADVFDSLAGIPKAGNDVRLTLNSSIQQAAQDALAGHSGACVVIDPRTGAILAMASSPSYAASDFESVIAAGAASAGGSRNEVGLGELVNRATQALYAPGSTFKIVSLGAALENRVASEESTYASPGEMTIGNGKVTSYDSYDYGTITLQRATELSSNTVFGQLGIQIGPDLLVATAEKFGFNSTMAFDLPLAMSLMPKPSEMTEWETAWSAVGQPVGNHESPAGPQTTVLQMAMVGCAIANNGQIQAPYLVDRISNAEGATSFQASPRLFSQALSAATAQRVKSVLEGVVNAGTGTAAAIPGIQVAGKTGTAETGKPKDDSWFVGLAPAESPTVVIALVLEQSAGDSLDASAKAQNVLRTALVVQGLL